MPACDECLRASVLRNEAMRYAERRAIGLAQARELLRMTPEEQRARLDELAPDAVESIDVQLRGVLGESQVWTVCVHDPEYPDGLTRLSDPPFVIYGFGEYSMFDELRSTESVALVGARRASAYGREVAYTIANDASAAGLVVVSGMALGVDGAAHRGAIQGGGRTIAVLAGGPETPYPRSHRLLHEQIAATGCAISETPPGNIAKRWAFAARNRLIAAIASITVFVEGTEQSGARHTMEFADQVCCPIAAVPGPVTSPISRGPNAWLRDQGAALVRDFSDIADELKLEVFRPQLPGFEVSTGGLSDEILRLVAAGESTPRSLADSLPDSDFRTITKTLGQLELSGEIVRDRAGEYRLSQ